MTTIAIPADWPVQPVDPDFVGATTCGDCGLSWDDSVSTSMTPAPAGRCPFEHFHVAVAVARFVTDPDTQTLGDDFQVLRPTRLARGTILAYYAMTSKAGVVLFHQGAGPDHRFTVADAYWVVDDDTGIARWDTAGSEFFPGLESEHEAWQRFAARAHIVPTRTGEDE